MNIIKEKKTEINLQSISNELLSYKTKPYDSLIEYIWNAFDASATKVEISYEIPEMGYIDSVEITDNGSGWDFSRDNTSFFLASDKALERASSKSLPRGRLGRGRYVFIWFFEKLEASSLGQKAIFTKDINYKFETSDINKGTYLKFTGGTDVITQAIKDTIEFQKQLVLEFGWFLKEIPNREIIINGKPLSITDTIEKSLTITKNELPKELVLELGENAFQCEVVLWKEKPNEYAKFYFIDSEKTSELFVATTKLNKKKDEFWHSVYIYCNLFDKSDFQQESDNLILELNSHNKLKKKILNELRRVLVELRKPILEKNADTVIKSLFEENIVPSLDKFGIYDTESFDALLKQVYVISPSIFVGKNKEEQSFICSMFAGILSSADENLIQVIIEQLQEMSEEDKLNLHDILKRTSLTNVTRTIKEIDRRLDVLAELEALLFTNKLETLEVKHLQEVLNRNIWIFDENFNLFSDTEGALVQVLTRYAKEVLDIDNAEIKTDYRGELDLFLVKNLEESTSIHRNLIIEIKRPSKKLGKKEFDQIEKYASKVMAEDICNGDMMYWEFILVGNDYDNYIQEQIDKVQQLGERNKGLTQNTKDGRKKVYIRRWSDILRVEQGHKMKYLKEKLLLRYAKPEVRSSQEIVSKLIN